MSIGYRSIGDQLHHDVRWGLSNVHARGVDVVEISLTLSQFVAQSCCNQIVVNVVVGLLERSWFLIAHRFRVLLSEVHSKLSFELAFFSCGRAVWFYITITKDTLLGLRSHSEKQAK